MSAKNRKQRKAMTKPRKRPSPRAPEMVVEGSTFQESLKSYEQADISPATAIQALTIHRQEKWVRWQAIFSEALTRAWWFLRAKYKTSTTKRLHVSETISLGEKRFVAIVAVEGREFLIGGGVSGVSLLAQLGAAPRSLGDLASHIGDSGAIL
jgi:hypothetical protein